MDVLQSKSTMEILYTLTSDSYLFIEGKDLLIRIFRQEREGEREKQKKKRIDSYQLSKNSLVLLLNIEQLLLLVD